MSIVILTLPDDARRSFSNRLHKVTGEAVELVILQKSLRRNIPFFRQIKNFYKNGGAFGILEELWHALNLRFSSRARQALDYFRERNIPDSAEAGFLPKILEVRSHNSAEALAVLKKISPDLLIVWSNTIISPEVISTAKHAINLHMGLCPHYRGSVANQYALLLEPERVGATVHHVEPGVDTGDIIETLTINLSEPPKEAFRDLNNRAEELFLDTAKKLHAGEKLQRQPQDKSTGKNFRLKDWTPKIRARVAKVLLDWEKRGSLTKV
ncbi:MAG: formyltransferase family protein [Minisyncoccia bacterium]